MIAAYSVSVVKYMQRTQPEGLQQQHLPAMLLVVVICLN